MPLLLLSYQQLINKNENGLMDRMPLLPVVFRFFAWCIVFSLLVVMPLQAEDEEVTLNFKDADLNVVIQTVSDITGRNFVIDPRVKGKVTVVSSRPMRADELYQVFLSVLEVHGFAAIPDGDTTRIVPAANAKQSGLPVVTGSRGAPSNDMITQVVQIKHVSAAQLVPVLRPLVPPQGHMAAYQSTNTLIISDRAANIARLRKIIRSIDRPGSSEVEVIQLQHASAAEVVRILSSLQQKGSKGKAQGIEGPLFVADERTNSILLGGDPAERLRMRRIITELDTPIEIGGGNTQVVYLRYAKAADLAKVLMGISEAEKKAVQQQAGGRKMGQPKGGKAISSVGPAGRAVMANISIQADEGTNALIITAPPDQFRSLQAVIAKLDIPRAQVLVETIIAEVSLDRKRELGVEWIVDGTSGGSSSGMAPIGTIDFGGISGLAGSIASAKAGKGVTLSSGLAMVVGNIGGAGTDFGALLRALTSDGSTNVLSTPNIVTMDNEEAEIVVGENRPFVTGSFTSTGGGSTPTNPFQTIKREDVGLKLKVRPQINEGSAVKLEIEQEISSVSQDSELGPYTNKRSIKTSVMVDNGKILVLGGLIDEKMDVREQRVPLLGDIPVLGWLFRYNNTIKVKRNLMVFMRPVILRDNATMGQLTTEKYNYIRGEQMEIRNSLSSLMRAEETPLMKKMSDFPALPPAFEETELGRHTTISSPKIPQTELALPLPADADSMH